MPVTGIDPGQGRMNGLQTTGRDYRDLNHKDARRASRVLAALAVAAVAWGSGLAQYPSVLPESLTIGRAVGVLAIAALLLFVPSHGLRLEQQGRHEGSPLEIQS
jgi:hypothetical protein